MLFLMTNDVECFSFAKNQYVSTEADRILKIGLPRLLDLYDKYDIDSTFFFTGNIVDIEPEVIDIVSERGDHEIGCHGFSHELKDAFDVLSLNQQENELQRAKLLIEKVYGKKIISFRAPAARINQDTILALEHQGFLIDSSISSQRFDGPLSYGSNNKINWFFAPRKPYFPSHKNIYNEGDSPILEIPIPLRLFHPTPLISLTDTRISILNIPIRSMQRNLLRN